MEMANNINILSKQKVLLLSTGDSVGGAYELMYRMAYALFSQSEKVCLAVKQQRMTDEFVRQLVCSSQHRSIWSRIKNSLSWRLGSHKLELAAVAKKDYVFYYNESEFSTYLTAEDVLRQIDFIPTIIFVGLTTGFVSTYEIGRLYDLTHAKIIYMMMDVSLLTGGCHVSCGCVGYQHACEHCPAQTDARYVNEVHRQYLLKKAIYQKMDMAVSCSLGLTERMLNVSSLCRKMKRIYFYSFAPRHIFSDKNRQYAKHIWHIPAEKKVIFAGADNVKDPRKGRDILVEALKILYFSPNINKDNILVVLAGNHNRMDKETSQIPFNIQFVDYIRDMRLLSLLYQAADVFVMSSREEGGPMMLSEVMMCGTPVVGTKTGYLETDDIIKDRLNGYRVPIGDSVAMSKAIEDILSLSAESYHDMSMQARNTALDKMSEDAFICVLKKYLQDTTNGMI